MLELRRRIFKKVPQSVIIPSQDGENIGCSQHKRVESQYWAHVRVGKDGAAWEEQPYQRQQAFQQRAACCGRLS